MTNELMLEAVGITKSYGAVQALRGIDFRIRRGETVALVGDNGAGKSTFVKILSGVTQPTSGTISFAGKSVSIDSTVTRWVTVSVKDRPTRGTAWTCAIAERSGRAVPTAATAATSDRPAVHVIERNLIGLTSQNP